ncbi:MAG: right-handed parallel beta-helix repeat-containing protein [Thermoplasmata archaeon]|nr:MAG: right-handed parallel beta-helix repeat-containing protein [Thermoplasmata archaeon]
MRKSAGSWVLCFVLLFSFLGAVAVEWHAAAQEQAQTLFVGGMGEGNFTTIQEAVDSANAGDTVFVFEGEYEGEGVIVDKSITLQGENRRTIIIHSSWHNEVVNITADGVNISEFTIGSVASAGSRYGMYLFKVGNCQISNIDFTACGIRCIFLDRSKNNTISGINSDITRGIILEYSYGNLITNCNITDAREGIELVDSWDNILSYNSLYDNDDGITIENSQKNTFIRNDLVDNDNGIYMRHSPDNTFANNTFIDSAFAIQGMSSEEWDSHTIDATNTVNGRPVYYVTGQTGFTVPSDAGQIILVNCSDMEIANRTFEHGSILAFSSSNITITGNNISSRYYGIALVKSRNNEIADNSIVGEYGGVRIEGSTGDKVHDNDISVDCYPLYIRDSDNASIYKNIITDMRVALMMSNVSHSTFTDNVVSIELKRPITLQGCSYLDIKRNVLTNSGFSIAGVRLSNWNTHTIDGTNTVNGKAVFYAKNESVDIIPPDVGQIILANCSFSEVKGQFISDVCTGITVGFSVYVNITDNDVSGNTDGFYIWNSPMCNISSNNAQNNYQRGIYLTHTCETIIASNNITDSDHAIELEYSHGNLISHNDIYSINSGSIHLYYSHENEILENRIIDSNWQMSLQFSHNNNIVGNEINGGHGINLYHSNHINIINNDMVSMNEGIGIWRSSDIMIDSNRIINMSQEGIDVLDSFDITISNNTISRCEDGLYIRLSNNITIAHNSFEEHGTCILLRECDYTSIFANTLSNYENEGIELTSGSYNNSIIANEISHGTIGIWVVGGGYNIISENDISFNEDEGVGIRYSCWNAIQHNNISNCETAIFLHINAHNNTITNNFISNSETGIDFHVETENNLISNNTFVNNVVNIWIDSDDDDTPDELDAFPSDPEEWEDSDGDGHGDNSDVFPNDPDEWSDRDGDGIGDNADNDFNNNLVPDHLEVYLAILIIIIPIVLILGLSVYLRKSKGQSIGSPETEPPTETQTREDEPDRVHNRNKIDDTPQDK